MIKFFLGVLVMVAGMYIFETINPWGWVIAAVGVIILFRSDKYDGDLSNSDDWGDF